MASGRLTLSEALATKTSPAVVGVIDEITTKARVIGQFPTRVVPGLTYKAEVSVELPTVGFTQVNKGLDPQKSRTEVRDFETYFLGSSIEIDERVAKQADGGVAGYMSRETARHIQAALLTLEKQAIYGVSNSADGFPGLKASAAFGGDRTVDAGGTTSSTASSIYLVSWGLDGVELVFGLNEYLSFTDTVYGQLADADGKKFMGYATQMNCRAGLGIGSVLNVGRIANVTAETGKGCTDALIAAALAKFRIGYGPESNPGAILMSRRSREQLRKSRTSTNSNVTAGSKSSTGVEFSAPPPTESYGIPILVTDNILDTDAIES